MKKYIAPKKINPGRVGMATKKVVIDLNIKVDKDITEDQMDEILTQVQGEYITPLQEQIDEVNNKSIIHDDDIEFLTDELTRLDEEIDNIEDNRITDEDKEEIKQKVVEELQEEIDAL